MGVWDFINYGMNQHKPDDETVAKISRFVMFFAKNTANYAWEEGLKCVPGGKAFFEIVSQTCHNEKEFQMQVKTRRRD